MNDSRPDPGSLSERIVCGVDGTPESLVAVEHAVRLQAADGHLTLISVAQLDKAAHAGFRAPHAADLLQQEAEAAIAAAKSLAPAASTKLVHGNPVSVLLGELEAGRAILVSVGSHGRGRAAAMLLGTVASSMLRDAPCSVLVARAAEEEETWPRSVVVGIDGSPESAAAFSAARSLAERLTLKVWAFAEKRPRLYHTLAGLGVPLLTRLAAGRGRFTTLPFAKSWMSVRDLPAPEGRTFQQLYAKAQRKDRR